MKLLSILLAFSFMGVQAHADSAHQTLKDIADTASLAESYEIFRVLAAPERIQDELHEVVDQKGLRYLCDSFEQLSYEDRSFFANAVSEDHELMSQGCIQQNMEAFERELAEIQRDLQTEVMMRAPTHEIIKSQLGPSKKRKLPSNASYNLPWDDPLPKGTFALTFDDGPHSSRTKQILDILDKENVKATFFVLGQAVDARPKMVAEIRRRGHTLGGHTYTHPDLSRRSYASAVREIEKGFKVIKDAAGESEPFFRFPYGAKTTRLMNYLKSKNIHHFFWRIDTLDWKKRDPKVLLPYAIDQTVKAGRGIVLFHDIHPQTVAIMPAFLADLKSRGYKIVVYDVR